MSNIDVKIAGIMGESVFCDGEQWQRKGDFIVVNGYVFRCIGPSDQEKWEPSARLDQAMEVVERMRADWFSFKAWQPAKKPYNPGDPELNIAVVSFICGAGPCPRHQTTHHNHHGAYDVEAESLPAAICKAALLALNVK